jgi:hypothetical protein
MPGRAVRKSKGPIWVAAILMSGAMLGYGRPPSPQPHPREPRPGGSEPAFGDPLAGLSDDDFERFATGQDAFTEVEEVVDGLGPVFNEASCGTCHNTAAIGGGSERLETRFGTTTRGRFDPLEQLGGSLLQDHGIGGTGETHGRPASCFFDPESVPRQATITALRRTTPLFGLGLVDTVPDSVFRKLAKRQKEDTPQTAGVVSEVVQISTHTKAVGKFGWKAQNPSLFQFSGDAYLRDGNHESRVPGRELPAGRLRPAREVQPRAGAQ